MTKSWITSALSLSNLILASANVIIGFSLLAYILSHNFRSSVARAFSVLLAFITVVYAGDILVANVVPTGLTLFWLRFQWLGIAFVPAATLHFADSLLRTTNDTSPARRLLVQAAYLAGVVFFVLAASTNWIVRDGISTRWLSHLVAGPLFRAFSAYFAFATAMAVWCVFRARQRCLTSTSRRRMTYLAVAIIAPGVGVYPYLSLINAVHPLTPNKVFGLSILGNVAVALMTVACAYTVAYQGVFSPDRVIKHNLVHYLLRAPLLGSAVVALMLVVSQVDNVLGLPRDTVMIFAVAIGIVLWQVAVSLVQPYIDRLLYREDRAEVAWIAELDSHLLTSTDLEQLLENVLVALCDLLRVPSGFVVAMQEGALEIRVFCGAHEAATQFLKACDWQALLASMSQKMVQPGELRNEDLIQNNGYWLLPLRSRDRQSTLGILGIDSQHQTPALSNEELTKVADLVGQAELALEDMHLQQDVFAALRKIVPEIEELRRWRSEPLYPDSSRLQRLESNPVYAPNFSQVVKEALRQYWGGPRLVNSPLMDTRLVREAMQENENVPARAVRAVLSAAIERLRPEGERSMTASQWMVYNILELKFVQGRRIREIAERMAISESDLYRKQRMAVEQLAKTLVAMELERNAAV